MWLVIWSLRAVAERNRETLDSWISTFDLQQDENGVFQFDKQQTEIWDALADLWDKHKKLVRTWNGAVADFNAAIAPKDIGRPLAASEAQKAEVLKRHKAGESIRRIAAAMSLGVSAPSAPSSTSPRAPTGPPGRPGSSDG